MTPDRPRCVWCHKTDGAIKSLLVCVPNALGVTEEDVSVSVHTEHEDETRHYYAYSCRYARAFLLSVLLGVAALFIFSAFGWEPDSAAVAVYFGVIIILFPFSSGVTFKLLGIRSGVRLARVAGFVVVLVGFALLYGSR